MNIKAAKYIQNLRGLTPSEKAVAYSIAVHADYQNCECTASMTTLAEESGLQHRQTASNIVKRLEAMGVVKAVGGRSGGRIPTTYIVNCDSGITVANSNRNSEIAVNCDSTATFRQSNRNFERESTATLNVPTATPQLHEGIKVLEGRTKGMEGTLPTVAPVPIRSKAKPFAPLTTDKEKIRDFYKPN